MPGASAANAPMRAGSEAKRSARRTARQLSTWCERFAQAWHSSGERVFIGEGSSGESIETIALAPVSGPAGLRDLSPAGPRKAEFLSGRALDEKQAASLRVPRIERPRPDAGVVVERRRLRQAEE